MIIKHINYAKVFNELLPICLKTGKELTIDSFFKFCGIPMYCNSKTIFKDIVDKANELRKEEKQTTYIKLKTDNKHVLSNDKTKNKQRQLYLSLCDELDNIIEKSGIKKVCCDCFNKGLYKHAEAPDFKNGGMRKKTYGCCKGCKYLGKDGCTTKSITCKLWLCSERLVAKIILAGYYHRWIEIVQICRDNGWSFHFRGASYRFVRMGVDDYPELREKILKQRKSGVNEIE